MHLNKALLFLIIGIIFSLFFVIATTFYVYSTKFEIKSALMEATSALSYTNDLKQISNLLYKYERDFRAFELTQDTSYLQGTDKLRSELNQSIESLDLHILYEHSLSVETMSKLKKSIYSRLSTLDTVLMMYRSDRLSKKALMGFVHNAKSTQHAIDSLQNELLQLETQILYKKQQNANKALEEHALSILLISIGLFIISLVFIVFFYFYVKSHQKIEKELRDINDNKSRFFSIISHDLRGPVKNISLMAQLLTENETKSIDKERIAKMIESSSKILSSLLDNLLKWSKLQMNQIIIQPEKIELYKLTEDIIRHTNVTALHKGITLINKVPTEATVTCDENVLRTILRNILSNGIKFTKPQGEVIVRALMQDLQTEIIIEDNGVGIPPEIQKRLFDLKYKHSTKGTNKEEGSGLGLKLCKEFVEKCGGTLQVHSEVGKGSSFSIILPS